MKSQYDRYSIHIKRIFSLALVLALVIIQNIDSYACTIFTKQQGNVVLVGNNEDFNYSYESNIWFVASKEGSFGRVCFANASYVQGGMNEKGLFYDGAACPTTKVPYSEDKPTLGMNLGEVVLSKCSSVDEAVGFLKNYNIPSNFGDHILFADETGKSVIVEWVEGEMKIFPKALDYQIAANYFLSNPQLGGYPSKRYDTAKSMLENEEEISIESFKNILSAVSQVWSNGGTKYSNIYDLKNKDVYVFCKRDYSKYVSYNLIDEMKKLKKGEKKSYVIDKLEYKTENISLHSSTESNVENGDKGLSDSLPDQAPIDKPDESTEQTKDSLEYKWWYSVPVVLVVLAFFVKDYIKIRRDKWTIKNEGLYNKSRFNL